MVDTSPLFTLIDGDGLHYFCDTDRCGSNYFMYDEEGGWVCNSCLTPPPLRPGARFRLVRTEPETVTTHKAPLSRWKGLNLRDDLQ